MILFLGIISCVEKEQRQENDENDSTKHNQGIQVGQFDSIYSKILNQERKLVIYLPESFKDSNRKKAKYPVVYLLDGSHNFIPFVGMLRLYSEMDDNTKILPEMIVVGIENIDFKSRMMDFSPTTDGNPEQFGGGEKFLSFIKKELFPYIEEKYSGSNNRTIIGQSFGGLVVMNALTNHSEMFDNYLMIDGSLYFDKELFLKNPKYSLKGKDLKRKNLYIGIANTATYGSNLESIKNDTIRANRYVRYSLELVNQIKEMNTDLNMKWKYYDNDTHGSSSFLSQLDGFRFFYSWFEFKKEQNYRSKYFVPKTKDDRFANLTESHFENVSEKLGYSFKPEKDWLSSYAYSLNSFQNQPEQALETYKLNIKYHPKTPSVYKDLADFYLSQKDTANAIINYKKALKFKDDSLINDILNEIE